MDNRKKPPTDVSDSQNQENKPAGDATAGTSTTGVDDNCGLQASSNVDNRKKPPTDVSDNEQQERKPAAAATASISTTGFDDNCVLFGRGKACNNHVGNKKMRSIIDRYRNDYLNSERGDKKLIVSKVHKELVDKGMKFLKQEDGIDGWIEADPNEAIRKVGHAIRCNRGREKSEPLSRRKNPPPAAFAQVASVPAVASLPAVSGQVPQGTPADVAATLALAGLPAASAIAGISSTNALQQVLGGSVALPIASNPLLSSLGNTSMPLTGLPPSLLASLGLSQPPQIPPSAAALSGSSAAEIYLLMERERQLREAMLLDEILRNSKRR